MRRFWLAMEGDVETDGILSDWGPGFGWMFSELAVGRCHRWISYSGTICWKSSYGQLWWLKGSRLLIQEQCFESTPRLGGALRGAPPASLTDYM